jgi:Zn-dependent metalloprotease
MRKLLTATLVSAALAAFGLTTAATAQPYTAKGWKDKLETVKQRGFEFLGNQLVARGDGAADDLKEKRVFIDEDGFSHLHVQQTYQGIPIFGGEAIVHLKANDEVFAFTDTFKNKVNLASLEASFDGDTAAKLAVDAFGCADCLTDAPVVDMWILREGKRDAGNLDACSVC